MLTDLIFISENYSQMLMISLRDLWDTVEVSLWMMIFYRLVLKLFFQKYTMSHRVSRTRIGMPNGTKSPKFKILFFSGVCGVWLLTLSKIPMIHARG